MTIELLIVDDDTVFLKVASLHLEKAVTDVQITAVTSVAEARAAIEQKHYDAILCDYQLPDTNGLELLDSLRRAGNTIPFIVVTAYSSEDVAIRALNLGASHYLTKGSETKRIYTELSHVIESAVAHERAKRSLQASEQRYRATIDSISDPLHVVDSNLRILLFNQAFEDWLAKLGLSSDFIGARVTEAFPFLDDKVSDEYQRVIQTGESLVTMEMNRLGDAIVWTETRKFPVFSDGKVSQIVTVVRDITQQKESEDRLKVSEEKYRTLVRSMRDIVFVYDDENRYAEYYASDASVLYTVPEQFLGKRVDEVLPVDVARAMTERMNEVRRTGRMANVDYPLELSGHTRWFSANLTLHEDGTSVVAVVRDITDRKRMEDALRRSEEWFRRLFDDSPIVINVFDSQGRLVDANKACLEFTGVATVDDLKGFNIFEDPNMPDSVRERVRKGEWVVGEGKLDFDVVRNRKIYPTTKTGTAFVQVAYSPLKYQGEVQGYMVQIVDVTQLKRQKDELSAFAHSMAHDLRSALHNILGYSSLIEEDKNPSYAPEISKIATRMNDLLTRSVALADSGLVIGNTEKVELGEVVSEVAARVLSPGIRLRLGVLPAVICDRNRIAQVIQNLLTNAVEHARPSNISVESVATDDGVHVLVSNDGIPIEEKHRSRMFEQGFTTKSGGGLGLTIVKRILEAHGWTVSLDPSEVTTFRIGIPSRDIVQDNEEE